MKTVFRTLFGIALLAACGDPGAMADDAPPVVVELFTSQGCNSCPPADQVMGDLAARDGVIALSWHVDYWDYIGWRDTFALPEAAERQRNYVDRAGGRYVYTPQMIVGGTRSVRAISGSAVSEAVDAAPTAPVRIATASLGGGRFAVQAAAADLPGKTSVWLVTFDNRHDVAVQRGENAGRTLSYFNVVRQVSRLATWTGEQPLDLVVDMKQAWQDGHDGCAVIVQTEGFGPVLGAARIVRPAKGG